MQFSKINLSGIKAVLIDLDDTLYKYKPSHNKALEACYYSFNKDFLKIINSFNDFIKIYSEKRTLITERLYPQGACRSRLFAFLSLFEELNINNSFSYALKYEQIYWENFINSMQIEPSALEFLHTCNNLKIPVCIVTDMFASIQILKIKKLNIDNLIKYLVTSEEVGVEKPNKIIFNHALSKLKLQPSNVIMVGDSTEKDISGASSLGIKSYKINLY